MRMWLVDVTKMCRQHLLAEHLEVHMFANAILAGKKLTGYITNGKLEVHKIIDRHQELVKEMNNRSYNHKTPMNIKSKQLWYGGNINIKENENILSGRCKNCKF